MLALRSIDTVAAGNAFLPIFMADYNTRFAKAPFDERDLHRPIVGDDDLDDAFAWKEDRTVSKNLTLQYDEVLFILEPNEITRSLACKRVMILDYPDGRFAIRHNGVDLPIGPSTSGRRSIRLPSLRINASVQYSPTLPRNRRSWTWRGRPRHRGGVASAITCSRSDRPSKGRLGRRLRY